MTRNHTNRPAWDAIEELVGYYLADERKDYEGSPAEGRGDHVYLAWARLAGWAKADREEAGRGYNGWSNYETWAAALWLDNDEDTHRYWREAARESAAAAAADPHVRDGDSTASATARRLLADRLQEELDEAAPIGMADLYSDLLMGALDAVDWSEVADGYLDELGENSDAKQRDAAANEADDTTTGPPAMALAVDRALFPLGRLVGTPGAVGAVPAAEMAAALDRHLAGDWGDIGPADRTANDRSLRDGLRLLSVYATQAGVTFWVVTEADRSLTTVLLPDEY